MNPFRRKAQPKPKSEHPSRFEGSTPVPEPEEEPLTRVPVEQLPISPLTGLPYDPELLDYPARGRSAPTKQLPISPFTGQPYDPEWGYLQGGQSNRALIKLMKAIEREIEARAREIDAKARQEVPVVGDLHNSLDSCPIAFPIQYKSPVIPAPERKEFLPDDNLYGYLPPLWKSPGDYTRIERDAKREYVRRLLERGVQEDERYAKPVAQLAKEVGLLPRSGCQGQKEDRTLIKTVRAVEWARDEAEAKRLAEESYALFQTLHPTCVVLKRQDYTFSELRADEGLVGYSIQAWYREEQPPRADHSIISIEEQEPQRHELLNRPPNPDLDITIRKF